jgi:hypothetical protein
MPNRRREPDCDNNQDTDSTPRPGFQFGRTVSIGMVVAMCAQLASAIWFAATTVSTVSAHSIAITQLQEDEKDKEKALSTMDAKLSSMDQNLHDIRDMMFSQPQRPAQLVMPMQAAPQAPSQVILQAPASMGNGEQQRQ